MVASLESEILDYFDREVLRNSKAAGHRDRVRKINPVNGWRATTDLASRGPAQVKVDTKKEKRFLGASSQGKKRVRAQIPIMMMG